MIPECPECGEYLKKPYKSCTCGWRSEPAKQKSRWDGYVCKPLHYARGPDGFISTIAVDEMRKRLKPRRKPARIDVAELLAKLRQAVEQEEPGANG